MSSSSLEKNARNARNAPSALELSLCLPSPLAKLSAAAAVLRRQNDPACHEVADGLFSIVGGEDPKKALGLKNGPGHRSFRTQAAHAERDRLLREAMRKFFPGSMSIAERAKQLASALARYRNGADWKRDRTADSILYRDTLRGYCWAILRAQDYPIGTRRIKGIWRTTSRGY